ncbi:MAG: YIP1 family protein, partial [Gemmatimonas sp.]
LVTALIVAVIAIATKNLVQPWFDAQADLTLKAMAAKGTPIPDGMASGMRTSTSWSIVIGAPLVTLVGPFINALFLLLGAKLMKANLSYAQAATVAVLAGVPRLFSWILMPVQALVSDAASARSLMDLSLSPARFVDPEKMPPAVLQFLGNLDVFHLWQLALTAIGVAIVSRVSTGTGAVIALIMFGIGAILQLAPSALM